MTIIGRLSHNYDTSLFFHRAPTDADTTWYKNIHAPRINIALRSPGRYVIHLKVGESLTFFTSTL